MNLTPDQIKHIQAVIGESNLRIQTLKDDLVDHVCCIVEYDLVQGKKFDDALLEAIDELAPEGLEKIEQQTLFLLNSTKISYMKKMTYLVGLASTISMSMGFLMKILHLPGAQELTIYGFLTFALIFLPLATIDRFKVRMPSALYDRLRISLGLASAAAIGLGLLLKLFHINGANLSILVGFLLFSFGFLPFFFFTMYKKSVT